MLDIKKNNIFSGSSIPISKVIDLNELIGLNQIFFYKENSNLHHSIKIKKVKFKDRVEDKILENIFKIDIIIIEDNGLYSLHHIRKITSLPVIIIQKDYKILSNFTKFDKIYEFKKEDYERNTLSKSTIQYLEEKYIINEINSGWSSNLSSIKQQWIRDKKIDNIFKFD